MTSRNRLRASSSLAFRPGLRRGRAAALLALPLSLAALAAPALAADAETTIEIYDEQNTNVAGVLFGAVFSPKAACESGRRISLVFDYTDGSRKTVDSGRTSEEGSYGLRYLTKQTDGINRVAVKVPASKVGETHCLRKTLVIQP